MCCVGDDCKGFTLRTMKWAFVSEDMVRRIGVDFDTSRRHSARLRRCGVLLLQGSPLSVVYFY